MHRNILLSIAFIVGTLSIAPYLVAYIAVETPNEEKLHFFYQDAELVYLTRIREIMEGNLTVASPFFYEYKGVHNIQQPFGEWYYAIFSLGQPEFLPAVSIALKFVLPSIFFLLVFGVVRLLFESYRETERYHYLIAMSIAVFVVLGYDFNNVGYWKEIISGNFSHPQLSMWTRLVHPITGALGLFGLMYLIFTFGRKYTDYRVIGAGILLGTMSGYIFSFALGLAMTGLFALFACMSKEWRQLRRFWAVLTIAIIMNTGYFFSLFTTHSDTMALTKNGLLLVDTMLHNKVLYIATFVFLLTTLFMRLRPAVYGNFIERAGWQWSCAALVASFVCLNLQVIFGKTVWPGHFVQYTNPISYIVFFTSLVLLFDGILVLVKEEKRRMVRNIIEWTAVGAILFICLVNIRTLPSVFSASEAYTDSQRYTPVFNWLTQNAETSCVVFVPEAEERLEKYIAAYTQCDLYHTAYVFHAVPFERILHNYILELRLLGITQDELSTYLENHPERIRRYFFEDWVDMFYNSNDTWVFNSKSEAEREAFLPKYTSLIVAEYVRLAGVSLSELLSKYKSDYLIIDQAYTEIPEEVQTYPLLFSSGTIVVYGMPLSE